MVKLDKIYTKGGDKGQTSLADGSRVAKNSPRIVAFGNVDHANSYLGLACLEVSDDISSILRRVQNDLFDLGSDLAVPIKEDDFFKDKRIKESQILFLEETIDFYNAQLSPLKSFILPGGEKSAALLHIARTAARMAEQSVVNLMEQETINPLVMTYLNRLSDLLFVLARICNLPAGRDVLWQPGRFQE